MMKVDKLRFHPSKEANSDTFSEAIVKEILQKYENILRDNKRIIDFSDVSVNNRVMAGIVLTTNMNPSNIRVVAISTGTKILESPRQYENICLVNDSHAEIIVRRSLLSFLYSQLECLLNDGPFKKKSIFMPSEFTGKLKLKPNYQFHLFISKIPCGDAAINAPGFDHLSNIKGCLQKKLPGGASPNVYNSTSCSDKIVQWNASGIQGALLSSIIDPIYFSSIILGSRLKLLEKDLEYSLYDRITKHIPDLPFPFIFKKPQVRIVKMDILPVNPYMEQNKPVFSLNWNESNFFAELINPHTGLRPDSQPSRLSKIQFFQRYRMLLQEMFNIFPLNYVPAYDYISTKMFALQYQVVKHEVKRAYYRANLGIWYKLAPNIPGLPFSQAPSNSRVMRSRNGYSHVQPPYFRPRQI